MSRLVISLTLAAVAASTPAYGKTRFETYEARETIFQGQGGSRILKDGIDFWTVGDPPRTYQIIGIIRDNRGTGPLHGNAVGSKGVAKVAREAGGDAVILLNQNTDLKGVWSQGQASAQGNQAFGSGLAIPIKEKVTTFVVVRYLPEAESEQ